MSKIVFHENEFKKTKYPKPQSKLDSFGISAFLVSHGLVKNIAVARKLNQLLMFALLLISLIIILVLNTSGGKDSIDEKYYYDPTLVD